MVFRLANSGCFMWVVIPCNHVKKDKRKGDETSGERNREKKRGEERTGEERGLEEGLDTVRKQWKIPK